MAYLCIFVEKFVALLGVIADNWCELLPVAGIRTQAMTIKVKVVAKK